MAEKPDNAEHVPLREQDRGNGEDPANEENERLQQPSPSENGHEVRGRGRLLTSEQGTEAPCTDGAADQRASENRSPEPTGGCIQQWFCQTVKVPHGRAVGIAILLVVLVLLIVATSFAVKVHHSCDQCVDLTAVKDSEERPPCEDDWIWYWNKCYLFSETEGDWTVANDSCAALHSFLAVIENKLELDFTMQRKGHFDYWIGLTKEGKNQWEWSDGSEFNSWFLIHGDSNCGYVNSEKISSGKCKNPRRWICTKRKEYSKKKMH